MRRSELEDEDLSFEEKVEALVTYYYDKPIEFVQEIIGASPTKQQRNVLESIADPSTTQISIKSGHGTGKTTVSAWICLWYLFTRPYSKIAVTAPTQKQLDQIFFPEIQKWAMRSPIMNDLLTISKREVVVKGINAYGIFSTSSSKQENLQGFHGEGGTLFIVDEASGVEDNIFEVVDGALTGKEDKLLMIGNPTKTRGTFYQSHTKHKHLYKTITLSCLDSENVSPVFENKVSLKYGKNSDVYRVRVLGEFPLSDPNTFISRFEAESCIGRDAESSSKGIIGCDPARFGDDDTVIYGAIGRNIIAHKTIRGKTDSNDIYKEIRNVVLFLREKGAGGRIDVKVDENGIGAGTVDILKLHKDKLIITVKPINSSWKGDSEHERMKDCLWGKMKSMLEFYSLPTQIDIDSKDYYGFEEDTVGDLIDEISMRKYDLNSSNKIVLETKDQLKERGLRSPNNADSLSLLMWDGYFSNNLRAGLSDKMKRLNFGVA